MNHFVWEEQFNNYLIQFFLFCYRLIVPLLGKPSSLSFSCRKLRGVKKLSECET